MLIAGLTGGLACGKSFVARGLAELGCYVIEADELGREVMQPGTETFHQIVSEFGPEILDEHGLINRPRLAARVFVNAADLQRLNNIVHPAVRERAMRRAAEIGARDPDAIVIYVAAILIESGAYRELDKLIVVTCTREQQMERALERTGATEADIRARIERQMPLEEKIQFADYVIDTSGAKEDTLRQIKIVYENLRSLKQ